MSTGDSLLPRVPSKCDGVLRGLCETGAACCKHYPVTALVSAIAILAYVSPSVATLLQLEFASIASGQWWRLLTGHLTHYGGQHLFWDLLMFVVLGVVCEREHPKLFAVSLIVMALGISVTIALTREDILGYRGLSGIDTGLFVWFIGDQIRQSVANRDRMLTTFWTAMGALLVGKLLFEFATGEVLFVDADGFEPLIESHLVGAACGGFLAALVPVSRVRDG